MTIIGIGTDLVNVTRIEKSISGKARDKFIKRIFTNFEQEQSKSRANEADFYAKRFAAKEAFVKALGTGIAKGIFWTDIEVRNDEFGKPSLYISGKALEILTKATPKDKENTIYLSLSDDNPFALAYVIISVE